MGDDLIERLRARTFSRWERDIQAVMEYEDDLATEAAAELARLRAENEALKTEREAAELASDTATNLQNDAVEYAVKADAARDAAEAKAARLETALDLGAAVSAAALTWCGEKDRETFMGDIEYFKHNWSALAGLTGYVERELGKRARAALEAKP